jgi:hypothetical protein
MSAKGFSGILAAATKSCAYIVFKPVHVNIAQPCIKVVNVSACKECCIYVSIPDLGYGQTFSL